MMKYTSMIHAAMVAIFLACLTACTADHASSSTIDTAPLDTTGATSAAIRVMSFNIRYDNTGDGDNQWSRRTDLVTHTIEHHAPDILGLQEALHHQLNFIDDAFPSMNWTGVGRDDGKTRGEYAPIFYRHDRFTPQERGTFWLSDTPDVPGSKSWGNGITRICTWVRLLDATTANSVLVFNVHFDHQSAPSRLKSAEAVHRRIADMRRPDELVLLMGDFNAGENSDPIRHLLDESRAPRLYDTYGMTHTNTMNAGTFNGFEGRADGDRIDWIFTTDRAHIKGANVVRDNTDGRYPSDHFPVTAVVQISSPVAVD